MGNFLHRTTKQLHLSVPPNELPDLPLTNYISNPDMSAVEGVPSIYWIITGDVISEMSVAEKAVVDAQMLIDQRDEAVLIWLDNVEEVMRQVVVSAVKEINILRGWITDFKVEVAAASSLGDLKTGIAGLPDLPDRTFSQVKNQIRTDLGT